MSQSFTTSDANLDRLLKSNGQPAAGDAMGQILADSPAIVRPRRGKTRPAPDRFDDADEQAALDNATAAYLEFLKSYDASGKMPSGQQKRELEKLRRSAGFSAAECNEHLQILDERRALQGARAAAKKAD